MVGLIALARKLLPSATPSPETTSMANRLTHNPHPSRCPSEGRGSGAPSACGAGHGSLPVIDDMAVFAAGTRPPSPQRHQRRAAGKAFEPIVIHTHPQPMADQPRRHRIEHLFEAEAAGRGDGDDRLLVIGGAAGRQFLQRRALEIEPLVVAALRRPTTSSMQRR